MNQKIYRFGQGFLGLLLMTSASWANEGAQAVAASGGSSESFKAMACALAFGLIGLAGALGQARVAASALEAIGRNPAASDKVFTPMIIGLALIESLVLYGFVVALLKV